MPAYVYRCRDCNSTFEVRHSMSEKQEKCTVCEGHNIFKVPSISKSFGLKNANNSVPGKIVDDYIRETKDEIKKEKKRMQSEEV